MNAPAADQTLCNVRLDEELGGFFAARHVLDQGPRHVVHLGGPLALRGVPLVFLHGFGGTKEDYADVAWHPRLGGRPVLAYDAPGCGQTTSTDLTATSVPFLARVAEAMIAGAGYDRHHLVGHSMGGLTALLHAHAHPERVAGFVNVEGNVAPEDCFLSRQIISHMHGEPGAFMADFVERLTGSRYYSSSLYASSLPHEVRAEAVEPIFTSMVDLSDHQPLLDWFTALPVERMIMFGELDNTLSYLGRLRAAGVELAEIPQSGHWPMNANAPERWRRIGAFVESADRLDPGDGHVQRARAAGRPGACDRRTGESGGSHPVLRGPGGGAQAPRVPSRCSIASRWRRAKP